MRGLGLAAGGMIVLLMMAGCGISHNKQPQSAGISGRAKVLELYPELGQAVLELNGQRVNAFWQTEETLARPGTTADTSALSAPVGMYQEATVQSVVFPAKVGDWIDFMGMRIGNEILLGRVAMVH